MVGESARGKITRGKTERSLRRTTFTRNTKIFYSYFLKVGYRILNSVFPVRGNDQVQELNRITAEVIRMLNKF